MFNNIILKSIQKIINVFFALSLIFASAGCCCPALQMNLSEKPESDDFQYTFDNIKVFVDTKVEEMLNDVALDYNDYDFVLQKNDLKTE